MRHTGHNQAAGPQLLPIKAPSVVNRQSENKVHASQASFTPVFPSSFVLLQTDNYDECFRAYIRPAIISLPLRYSVCVCLLKPLKKGVFPAFWSYCKHSLCAPSLSAPPPLFAPLLIPLSVTRHPPSLPVSPSSSPPLSPLYLSFSFRTPLPLSVVLELATLTCTCYLWSMQLTRPPPTRWMKAVGSGLFAGRRVQWLKSSPSTPGPTVADCTTGPPRPAPQLLTAQLALHARPHSC